MNSTSKKSAPPETFTYDNWTVSVTVSKNGLWIATALLQYRPGGLERAINSCENTRFGALLKLASKIHVAADAVLFGSLEDTTEHYKRIARFASYIDKVCLKERDVASATSSQPEDSPSHAVPVRLPLTDAF